MPRVDRHTFFTETVAGHVGSSSHGGGSRVKSEEFGSVEDEKGSDSVPRDGEYETHLSEELTFSHYCYYLIVIVYDLYL